MKRWLLMTMAMTLAAAGCASTTTARPAANVIQAQRQLAENASPDVDPEAAERATDEPAVVIVATSPRDVQFRAGAGDVLVPPRHPHPRTITARRAMVHQGMLIGTVVGVIAGALLGAEDDSRAKADPDVSCAHCNAILGSTFLGAVGLGAGAAVGAVAGTFDGP
jgi:hypothetical protein